MKGKLVRDRIPEIIKESGATPNIRILNEAECDVELDKKLDEEVREYLASGELEELADILEVISSIAEKKNSSMQEIDEIRRKKLIERGGFKLRIFLIQE